MKILCIGSHADDIELGCGGMIARAIENGNDVMCLFTSNSVFTDEFGNIKRDRDCVVKELARSMKCLGVKNYKELDFPAKDIPYNSDLVGEIDKVINKFKPNLVLTHWVFDTHQSHRNTALATISASRNLDSILMYEPFPPSGRSYMPFKPQIYFEINIKKKIKAIKAHKSQLKKYGVNWLKSVEGRAKMRGYEMRKDYGEVFEAVRLRYNL